jgi:hypothetical protein
MESSSACISTLRHAIALALSLTGFGKRPDLTPASQQDRLTGMIGSIDGFDFESPRI